MAQRSGRVACPRCGSNNFDTVTVCWKCGAPLTGAPAAAVAAPVAQPALGDRFGGYAATAAASIPVVTGSPSAANRAAFWLGILFPYFGFPIGLAFVMCDDRRRQEVGRICILWSLISGAIHLLLFFVSLLGMREWIAMALNIAKNQASRAGGMGGLGGLSGE